jgi:hypothetical protein
MVASSFVNDKDDGSKKYKYREQFQPNQIKKSKKPLVDFQIYCNSIKKAF